MEDGRTARVRATTMDIVTDISDSVGCDHWRDCRRSLSRDKKGIVGCAVDRRRIMFNLEHFACFMLAWIPQLAGHRAWTCGRSAQFGRYGIQNFSPSCRRAFLFLWEK